MALGKCKECGKEVSESAKLCPHCGKKYPTGGMRTSVKVFLVLLLLGVLGQVITDLTTPKTSPHEQPTTTAQAQSPKVSHGSRKENLDQIVSQLVPLFESYKADSDAPIVRMQLNASAWNAMSADEQQQLGDMLASKAIVQEMKNVLYLYVFNTKVGEIGPGWGGEWRYRRTE